MRYFIFLFPLFAICQSNSQSAGGFRFYNTNKSNITLYQTTGSRFYHEKFLTSIIKGKKVEVRFDAFKDAMYISCLLYTSPSPRDSCASRMPSSA